MSVLDDRIEAATVKYEAAAAAADVFTNGDENTEIQTDSGPLPTLKKWLKDLEDGLKVNLDGGTF